MCGQSCAGARETGAPTSNLSHIGPMTQAHQIWHVVVVIVAVEVGSLLSSRRRITRNADEEEHEETQTRAATATSTLTAAAAAEFPLLLLLLLLLLLVLAMIVLLLATHTDQ